jgi:hypothetical protein
LESTAFPRLEFRPTLMHYCGMLEGFSELLIYLALKFGG